MTQKQLISSSTGFDLVNSLNIGIWTKHPRIEEAWNSGTSRFYANLVPRACDPSVLREKQRLLGQSCVFIYLFIYLQLFKHGNPQLYSYKVISKWTEKVKNVYKSWFSGGRVYYVAIS